MSNKPANKFSANSKKIRKFNSGHKFGLVAYIAFFILPISGIAFWYTQNKDKTELISMPTQIASFASAGSANDEKDFLPNELVASINAIETNGILYSSHVVAGGAGTDVLASGSKMSFDRSTWESSSPDSGTIDAYVSTNGKVYNGKATMTSSGGVWKISAYSTN